MLSGWWLESGGDNDVEDDDDWGGGGTKPAVEVVEGDSVFCCRHRHTEKGCRTNERMRRKRQTQIGIYRENWYLTNTKNMFKREEADRVIILIRNTKRLTRFNIQRNLQMNAR